ncbi:hypothetical protein DAPPUDRAFT_321244 [Daphnia pulex]|uniref:THAP-type domain-containing protein n=1 Tax=Daphnia pulex TaxID=6669 RepID=E9GSD0_DAPPU|nr:hypothetical protein DAPPUDRAFT_321244 [Daphnia pulex]|eukprot:EFX77690.1 hypothetical protein DAPPUDRAFT_321244 [Daphnia pulex]
MSVMRIGKNLFSCLGSYLQIGSHICGRHFEADDIIRGREIGGVFHPYTKWNLKELAIPKHLICKPVDLLLNLSIVLKLRKVGQRYVAHLLIATKKIVKLLLPNLLIMMGHLNGFHYLIVAREIGSLSFPKLMTMVHSSI